MKEIKNSIFSKVIICLIIVSILSLLITGISFGIMMRSYIIGETRRNLLEEGEVIGKTLGTLKNVKDVDIDIFKKLRKLNVLAKTIDVNFAVLDNDNTVVYSKQNTSKFDIKRIDKSIINRVRNTNQPVTEMGKKVREFLVAALPITDNSGNIKAVLVLYTPVNGLNVMSFSIFRILMLSILVSIFISSAAAYIIARKISSPINMLKEKTEKISKRDFNIIRAVNTGDEIEELDESFNNMVLKIKEYDDSQKMLLQNISHELKTPLMSVQGYAEGIKDGVIEGPDVNKSLDIIINESCRMKKLVDDIILLTKLESMIEIYNFSDISLSEVVHDSIDKIKSLALKKNTNIEVLENEQVQCRADSDKLSQVIINIVGNNIRYAKSLIRVCIARESGYGCIIIENDGETLSIEDKCNIFKRFYRGKNGGQTGLGLAIAQAIVYKHGGKINVDDSSLGGLKFTIKLPLDHQ